MSINLLVGIVIGTMNPRYPCKAQVRIPAIHGMPKSDKYYKRVKNSNIAEAIAKAKMLNINLLGDTSNQYIIIDDEIPWYPICFGFGSKIGPQLGDLVWMQSIGDGNEDFVVMGSTGNIYVPEP